MIESKLYANASEQQSLDINTGAARAVPEAVVVSAASAVTQAAWEAAALVGPAAPRAQGGWAAQLLDQAPRAVTPTGGSEATAATAASEETASIFSVALA